MTTVSNIIYKYINGENGLNLAQNESLIVKTGAAIYAIGNGGASAVYAASDNDIQIDGALYSANAYGIASNGNNHEITVSSTGSIFGRNGGIVISGGDNAIVNAGSIDTIIGGAVNAGSGAGHNALINTGSLRSGANSAVILWQSDNSFTNGATGNVQGGASSYGVTIGGSVNNAGLITGGGGISMSTGGTALNTGDIIAAKADLMGILGSAGADAVVNNGLIQGPTVAINLGAGKDVYNGAGGKAIGEVNGAAGDDTLVGGVHADILRGGIDNDTLNGGGGVDFLDGGVGDDTFELAADTSDTIGDASGIDTVTSTITRSLGTWAFIENLVLEGAAHINGTGSAAANGIVGNGGNNVLAGLGGNDTMIGGGGNDQLFGQADKDSLTGGAGNDGFVFQSAAHTAAGFGDVIVDFDDSGEDFIDLSGMAGVSTFIGAEAFSAAGQVRAVQQGANVLVQINTAGNSVAEGEITILNATLGNGVGMVNAADFLL